MTELASWITNALTRWSDRWRCVYNDGDQMAVELKDGSKHKFSTESEFDEIMERSANHGKPHKN